MSDATASRSSLAKYAWLAIAAAIATIALKYFAYRVTGSVGLLSDAAESIVNLVAAVAALVALRIAALPADDNHHFGHAKAEYFSAVLEAGMILVAAGFIIFSAIRRLFDPLPLENVGLGLGISVVASIINGVVAMILIRAGRAHRSITLTADGKHLLTDVWTSAGVLVGVLLVQLTGWLPLDPIVALVVGINIIVTGVHVMRESVDGLMDHALPQSERAVISKTLAKFSNDDVHFHAIRCRAAGHQRFVSFHVLVPGSWSIDRGHDMVEEVEAALRESLDDLQIDSHLEPSNDPRAYADGHGDSVGTPPNSGPVQ